MAEKRNTLSTLNAKILSKKNMFNDYSTSRDFKIKEYAAEVDNILTHKPCIW